jgi:hypothetical protein
MPSSLRGGIVAASSRGLVLASSSVGLVYTPTLTPPDPYLKGARYPGGFNPCAYRVETRFQNVPFKWVNSLRYASVMGLFGSSSSSAESAAAGENATRDDDEEEESEESEESAQTAAKVPKIT